MKKYFFAAVLFIAASNLFCQSISAVKLAAGLFIPTSGQTGTSINFELIDKLNDKWSLYISSGILNWSKNSVAIDFTYPYVQSYSEDSHQMIPFYFGARVNISTIKTINIFANLELGYSYLQYDSFENVVILDNETRRYISFYVDGRTKKRVTENLFGVGAGLGFSNDITNTISIICDVKRSILTNDFEALRNEYIVSAGIIYKM